VGIESYPREVYHAYPREVYHVKAREVCHAILYIYIPLVVTFIGQVIFVDKSIKSGKI
jgi:hypothetical protein